MLLYVRASRINGDNREGTQMTKVAFRPALLFCCLVSTSAYSLEPMPPLNANKVNDGVSINPAAQDYVAAGTMLWGYNALVAQSIENAICGTLSEKADSDMWDMDDAITAAQRELGELSEDGMLAMGFFRGDVRKKTTERVLERDTTLCDDMREGLAKFSVDTSWVE
jgi:hypothetical protein